MPCLPVSGEESSELFFLSIRISMVDFDADMVSDRYRIKPDRTNLVTILTEMKKGESFGKRT